MSIIWKVIITIIALVVINIVNKNIANNEQWSKMKRLGVSFAFLIISSGILYFSIWNNSSASGLVKDGQKYVLERLNSPSTATFLSYVNSSNVRKIVKDEWGLSLKSNWDIVMIEVEGTNGFGGRIRTTYAVFFKDGKPLDMMDADNLNKETLNRTLSYLGY